MAEFDKKLVKVGQDCHQMRYPVGNASLVMDSREEILAARNDTFPLHSTINQNPCLEFGPFLDVAVC